MTDVLQVQGVEEQEPSQRGKGADGDGARSREGRAGEEANLDQGLVGDVIDGSVLLLLLLVACFSPRGPRRAVALFLVVYCLIASFTESGLGEASPYLLDLTVAMSILMTPATLAPEAESPAALRPQL